MSYCQQNCIKWASKCYNVLQRFCIRLHHILYIIEMSYRGVHVNVSKTVQYRSKWRLNRPVLPIHFKSYITIYITLHNWECSIRSQFHMFIGTCSAQVLKHWNWGGGAFLFPHGRPFAQSLKYELCQLLDDSEQNICPTIGNGTSFPCTVLHLVYFNFSKLPMLRITFQPMLTLPVYARYVTRASKYTHLSCVFIVLRWTTYTSENTLICFKKLLYYGCHRGESRGRPPNLIN